MTGGETTLSLFHDFGGQGALAHLAPANGFPPQAYTPFVAELRDLFHVRALLPLPMRADGPPPPHLDWHLLAEEMAQRLQEAGMRDLVGFGHSLGGVMSLLAAIRHPGLFRALVLLDPVIFPRGFAFLLRVLRLLGLGDRFPLVRAARRRRRVFSSRQEAAARYRRHPFFGGWVPDAFEAYVEYGLRPRPDGRVELAYPPEWEAAIFDTSPTDIWRWVPRVEVPVILLYGERSNTFRPAALRRLQRQWPHARFVPIRDAGHMFPMEKPTEAARLLREHLDALGLLT